MALSPPAERPVGGHYRQVFGLVALLLAASGLLGLLVALPGAPLVPDRHVVWLLVAAASGGAAGGLALAAWLAARQDRRPQRGSTGRAAPAPPPSLIDRAIDASRQSLAVTDRDGLIEAANPAFCRMTGYDQASLTGLALRRLEADGDLPGCNLTDRIGLARFWQGNVRVRHRQGAVTAQWLTLSALCDQDGLPVNFVAAYTDLAAIRDNVAQMEHLAHHDPLTNLPNRLALQARLNHALEGVRRRTGLGAVLFIDLDYFKQINDTLGHRFGDELLQQLVQRLRHRLRESDTLARLGGDEFVALLEDIGSPNDAATVAATLIEQARLPFTLSGGHQVKIGSSIGISLFPGDAVDADALLHHADLALYQAKAQGRGRYCFFNQDHAEQAEQRLSSNSALHAAMSSGGLMLYFQPIVSLVDGKVQGSEALLRWRAADGKLLTPDQFMPMAENTALMGQIGDWVLRQACRAMKTWVDAGLALQSVTVNLSLCQFKAHDLPQRIGKALDESGLAPHMLELDITEAAVMPRGDDPLSRLKDLKSLGLRLAIDDFGTGYSSFAKLGQYPVDKIKVDGRFVREIGDDPGGTAAAIVAMAHLLNIPVQAEGVETETQRHQLLRSQCAAGQGYLFSHPMPEADFDRWCRQNHIN